MTEFYAQPYSLDHADHLAKLVNNATVHQGSVDFWFDEIDDLDEMQATQILFLLVCGYSLEDALERFEDVCLFEGTASDYAYELIEETTEVPENLRYYIDYDAIARDMEINGEICEIHHELIVTNAHDF